MCKRAVINTGGPRHTQFDYLWFRTFTKKFKGTKPPFCVVTLDLLFSVLLFTFNLKPNPRE